MFFCYVAGHVRQPKWGHLRYVHKAIKLCEEALEAIDPKICCLGQNLEVFPVFIGLLRELTSLLLWAMNRIGDRLPRTLSLSSHVIRKCSSFLITSHPF